MRRAFFVERVLAMKETSHVQTTLFEYAQVIFGAVIVGLAYNIFLLPAKLAAGGLSGISTILFEVYAVSPAMTQFVFNIPIFIIGWIFLGRDFSGKSLVGTFCVPFVIWLSADLSFAVTNPFLATLYGGILLGIGLGIVYRGNGSTGGTAALAQILKKFTGLSSGYSQLIIDGFVVGTSLFVFNVELTLYALMCIFVTSKTIDFIQLRTSSSKLILIITEKEAEIEQLIQEEIDRGLTKIQTVGGYSKEEKTMILCVVEQAEAIYLKKRLEQGEPSSFVIFINASDIMGRGFSIDKYYGQKL